MRKIRNIEEKKLMVAYCILKRNGEKQELTNKLIRDVWKSVAKEDLCIDKFNIIVGFHDDIRLKHKNMTVSKKIEEQFKERKKVLEEIFLDVRKYVNDYSMDEVQEMLQTVRDQNQGRLYELAAPMRLEVMQFIHGNDYKNFGRTARYHVVRHCEDDHGKIDLYISGDYEEVRDKLLKEQLRGKKRK